MPRVGWRSFGRSALHLLFVLYCIEAGVFLTLLPWREGWQSLLTTFPVPSLRAVLTLPVARGAITGFGLIHLVWGAHDLRTLFRGRRREGGPEGGHAGEGTAA